jgi:hypothetical protein
MFNGENKMTTDKICKHFEDLKIGQVFEYCRIEFKKVQPEYAIKNTGKFPEPVWHMDSYTKVTIKVEN